MSRTTLTARPLADMVERMLADATPEGGYDSGEPQIERRAVYARLGVAPRSVFAWKRGERPRVQIETADRVLSASPFLWFDVWQHCPVHPHLEDGCAVCEDHYHARLAFTGVDAQEHEMAA